MVNKKSFLGFVLRNIFRVFLFFLGVFFIFLGFAGMVLPVMPGMIFSVIGLGLIIRSLPFSKIIFKIPKVKEKLKKNLPMKTKVYLVLSLWIPYMISQVFIFYYKYDASLQNFVSQVGESTLSLFGFLVPPTFLFVISVYILWVKNIGQIFGYKDLNGKKL